MEITNNTTFGIYTNDYKSKKMTKQESYEDTVKSKASWQTLNYYRDNAVYNGYFEQTNGTDSFKSVKQDWMKMVQLMMKDYMEAGLFKQSLDGKGLLGIFERYASIES